MPFDKLKVPQAQRPARHKEIVHSDSLDVMVDFVDDSVDLIRTSPMWRPVAGNADGQDGRDPRET